MNIFRRRWILLSVLWGLVVLPVSAKRAPNLQLKDLAGHTQKLAGLRGEIVVLNFWATWCAPCQEELPRLSQLAQSYAGRPVHFIAISIDEAKDRSKIQPVLEKGHISLETWIGADTETMGSLGLGDIVPGTVILDQQGEIITRVMGEAREEDIRGAVDWLLHGRSGAAPAAMTKRY
jgi:thiol-disulfide isomerase/thioredoxin